MVSRNAAGSASKGVISLKRMPGLGKSGMSRIYLVRSITWSIRNREECRNMPWTVRVATPADADVVIEFNRLLALESEGKTLDLTLLTPGVHAALADAHKGRYFLAGDGGEGLGQMGI